VSQVSRLDFLTFSYHESQDRYLSVPKVFATTDHDSNFGTNNNNFGSRQKKTKKLGAVCSVVPSGRPSFFPLIYFALLSSSFYSTLVFASFLLLSSYFLLLALPLFAYLSPSSFSQPDLVIKFFVVVAKMANPRKPSMATQRPNIHHFVLCAPGHPASSRSLTCRLKSLLCSLELAVRCLWR
jgi:hypothetical protein